MFLINLAHVQAKSKKEELVYNAHPMFAERISWDPSGVDIKKVKFTYSYHLWHGLYPHLRITHWQSCSPVGFMKGSNDSSLNRITHNAFRDVQVTFSGCHPNCFVYLIVNMAICSGMFWKDWGRLNLFFLCVFYHLSTLKPSSYLKWKLYHLPWLLLLSCFSHVRLCATPQTTAHQLLSGYFPA